MSDIWNPNVEEGPQALYERIIASLEIDMRSGDLPPGTRLPPQRQLAHKLKLSVGTVTKAYVEAESRGLVTSHVGRGTFVADPWGTLEGSAGSADQLIDLSLNVVPSQPASRRYADSFAMMKRRPELLETLNYAPPIGLDAHRKAASTWLAQEAGYEADWNQIVMTIGAQHAMLLTIGALCRPGDTILCEAATYYGIKSIAEHSGLTLYGLPLDEEGITPEALDKAAAQQKASVLYVMPSSQNPTGRTMSRSRREEIVAVARKRDLWIVEDDLYAMFPQGREGKLPTLAELAPERTIYVGGVSKSLAPGLRTGYLVCPPGQHLDAIVRGVRATIFAPPTIGAMFFAQWVEDGSAFEIAKAVRKEVADRAEIAREIFGNVAGRQIGDVPHFWLEMPEIDAERVAGRALRRW